MLNNFKKKLICWGGGDQCIVIQPIIESLGSKIDVIIDDTPNLKSPINNVDIFQGKEGLNTWLKGRDTSEVGFIIAIGNPYGHIRHYLHQYMTSLGLCSVSFADPSAIVDQDVSIGPGVQIMRGVIINAKATIGIQCILNTRSIIEHHDKINDGAEIGPGAVLCGRVQVGKYSWVAAGATILPRICIGEHVIVGAGAVVCADVSDRTVVVGVPARYLKSNDIGK